MYETVLLDWMAMRLGKVIRNNRSGNRMDKERGKEQWHCVQGAALSIQRFYFQYLFVAPWDTQPFILSRLIKRVPGIFGDLVVKYTLSPVSYFVALRQTNPIHKQIYNVFLRNVLLLK